MRNAWLFASMVLVPGSLLWACVGDAPTSTKPDGGDATPDGQGAPEAAADGEREVDGAVADGDAGKSDSGDGAVLTACGDGALVDLQSDPQNCGTCGTACAFDGGAPNTGAVCVAGKCGVGCAIGWGDCDMNAGNGCELPVSTVANCGACGHVCGAKNASPQCVLTGNAFACKLNCAAGTASCDNQDSTGCEADISSEKANCGACGFDCQSATCSAGLCLLASAEDITADPSDVNPLAVDGTRVFWASQTTHTVRAVDKAGTNLASIRTGGEYTAGVASAIAVDANYAYVLNNPYSSDTWRILKSGAAAPENIGQLASGYATQMTFTLDATNTAAKHVFSSQCVNGAGVYHYDLTTTVKTLVESDSSMYSGCDARGKGLTFVGGKLYYGLQGKKSIGKYDVATKTTTGNFWTNLPCSVTDMTTDGTKLYFTSCDRSVYSLDLPGGTTKTTLATAPNGYSGGFIVTDGTYLYLSLEGSRSVHRLPKGAQGVTLGPSTVVLTLPGGAGWVHGLAMDGSSLYVTDNVRVYRGPK